MLSIRFVTVIALAMLVVVLAVVGQEARARNAVVPATDQTSRSAPLSNAPSPIPTPGWRTPQSSKYYPPFIPTPGWRTPPTSDYTR